MTASSRSAMAAANVAISRQMKVHNAEGTTARYNVAAGPRREPGGARSNTGASESPASHVDVVRQIRARAAKLARIHTERQRLKTLCHEALELAKPTHAYDKPKPVPVPEDDGAQTMCDRSILSFDPDDRWVPWRTYVKLEENERRKAAVAGGAEGAAAKEQLRAERTCEREERRAKKMATRKAAKTKRNKARPASAPSRRKAPPPPVPPPFHEDFAAPPPYEDIRAVEWVLPGQYDDKTTRAIKRKEEAQLQKERAILAKVTRLVACTPVHAGLLTRVSVTMLVVTAPLDTDTLKFPLKFPS